MHLFRRKDKLKHTPTAPTQEAKGSSALEKSLATINDESVSRSIEDYKKPLIPNQSLSTGASCVYSPTHHLLSDAASILRHCDGLAKGELP